MRQGTKLGLAIAGIAVVVLLLHYQQDFVTFLHLSDAKPLPNQWWIYPRPEPVIINEANSRMVFQKVHGDVSAIAETAQHVLWYGPVFSAAGFLTISITSLSWVLSTTPRKRDAWCSVWRGGTLTQRVFRAISVLMGIAAYTFIGNLPRMLDDTNVIKTLVILIPVVGYAHYRLVRWSMKDITKVPPAHRVWWIHRWVLIGACILGGGQLIFGALFSADTSGLIAALDQSEALPRARRAVQLFEVKSTFNDTRRQGVEDILGHLDNVSSVDAIDMKLIRRAMETATGSNDTNIVSVNLLRAAVFVALTTVALIALVFIRRMNVLTLITVLIAYATVGTVFGVVYYDYYVLDAARYNLLLDICLPLRLPIKGVAAQGDADPPLVTGIQDVERRRTLLGQLDRIKSHPSLLMAVKSSYFASSVFAQDRPQIVVDDYAPNRSEPKLSTTYQFTPYKHAIVPSQKLSYPYVHKQENDPKPAVGDDAALIEKEAERPGVEKCVQAVFDAENIPRKSVEFAKAAAVPGANQAPSPPVEPGTNAESHQRLATFLCSEAFRPHSRLENNYFIDVSSGADCSGDSDANRTFSARRRAEVLRRLKKMIAFVRSRAEDDASRAALGRIEAAARNPAGSAEPESAWNTSGGKSKRCDSVCDLWPRSDQSFPPPEELNPWRAAKVEISQESVDANQRLHMASGLATDTSLSDMMYFSFVSFTTTGYGDIKAVSGPVRFCVILENILEIIFTAVFFTAAMNHKIKED